MPLTSKLNLEVGARTWRFNSGEAISGQIPKRGGYWETAPRTGRPKSKPSSAISPAADPTPVRPQSAPKSDPIIEVLPEDPGPSEEAVRIDLERRILAEEKMKIEEMNRHAQETLEQAELIRQKVTEAQEINAMAAKKEAEQRLLHQQAIEEEKQQLLFEADRKLQQVREEMAVNKQKYETEFALLKERQERTLALESEAEARAKAREAAEEARATQRERELIQERAESLERLKQEAMEEYRRTHDELRRAQEEQLRKELEDARQAILEESAARKAALEAEREATLLQLKEEAQLEYQKQLESHLQLGKETTEALKEASAKAAEEFKLQSQEAIKSLRSIASDSYPRSERSAPVRSERSAPVRSERSVLQKSSAGKSSSAGKIFSPNPTSDGKTSSSSVIPAGKPTPAPCKPGPTDEEIQKKREAMRQRLLLGVFTPNVNRIHEWGLRSAPAPFPATVPSPSAWESPANRQRANSVGQVNLSTPFNLGSAMVTHLNHQQIAPLRGSYNQDPYSRSVNAHPSRGDLYCNPSTAHAVNRMTTIPQASPAPTPAASNSLGDQWGTYNNLGEQLGAATKKNEKAKKSAYQGQSKEVTTREQQTKVEKYAFQYTEPQYDHDDDSSLPVTTMSTIRGYNVVAVYGHVRGVGLRNSTKEQNERTLAQERDQATLAMWRQAERKGANFVIGLKFQNIFVSLSLTEILATGTAVRMEPSAPTMLPPPGSESQNVEQNAAPPTKPNKGQKGTGTKEESQNGKKKNKGKRNDESVAQVPENSWGGDGWVPPPAEDETSDQGDDIPGYTQHDSTGWGGVVEEPKKKQKEKREKKAKQNEPEVDLSGGWGGWDQQAAEQEDDNEDDDGDEVTNAGLWMNDFNDAGDTGVGWNEPKKSENGNKKDHNGSKKDQNSNKKDQNGNKKGTNGNKGGKDESQKKGTKEKGKQVRDDPENQTSTPDDDPTNRGKQNKKQQNQLGHQNSHPPEAPGASPVAGLYGAYGQMNSGAMVNRSQQPREWNTSPSLAVVHPGQAWSHSGPPGHDYDDPRAMYPYRRSPRYEQEAYNRRGPGHDFHPMYHSYPSFPMPVTAPPPHYPYVYNQRPPMQLGWASGGEGHGYQAREELSEQQHSGGDSRSSRTTQNPNGNGWNTAPTQPKTNHDSWGNSNTPSGSSSTSGSDPSDRTHQAPQNNFNKAPQNNSNTTTKGKGKTQAPKKSSPAAEPESTGWDFAGWGGTD
ncbi:hypothetical protein Pst134EB_016337 [Puccinia striiformis f. sp. tritici]|nr:hypothetical protein Pst134EB_016337 [Puccinia striiformis f. sp. tritici]